MFCLIRNRLRNQRILFATQKSTYWNGGNTKELTLSKDQQAGGRAYSKSRLDRATKGEDGWENEKHKPMRKNAQDARKAIKQAKKEGKLSYENMIFM